MSSNDVIPEVEEAWGMVIDACQQAWPERKPLMYSDSPTELIIEIINERDELRAELEALKGSRVETTAPLSDERLEGVRQRHALVERSSDPTNTAAQMAYLSHLDRGDLLQMLERLWTERDELKETLAHLARGGVTAETSHDAEDAAKWRALRNCARITAIGSSGLHIPDALARPDAHVTLNFWTHGEHEKETYHREWLDQFAFKAQRLAVKSSGEVAP